MNEFIKKLIKRLEEVSYNHFDLKLSEAISIVNQQGLKNINRK